MSTQLRAQVTALLDQALERYAGTPAADTLVVARTRLVEPLRVAIAGKVKAGKSTLLNALVGEPLAPTDAGECTRIVTWYTDGLTYRVTLHPVGGKPRQVPFRRANDALAVRLEGLAPSDVERLVVEWPSPTLRMLTLIDTPGIGSLSTDLAARAKIFLAPDDRPGEADAVCYLMRHLHATDAGFLEAFRDDATRGTPMNAIGVLSRADEIGVGRLNALETAERIARRYRADPHVRRLCQTVLPVAGLLAQAGVTLRQDEYDAITALVGTDRAVLDPLLLSADRFTMADAEIDVGADTRRMLLDRIGLFGVRVSMALVRSGQARTATDLAAALVRRSGVDALRTALATQFADRADLLKARSGLAVLTSVLRTRPGPAVDDLAAAVERIVAGTHAFAEARLLNELRSGNVAFPDDASADAERLLGGEGDTAAARLGLAEDTEAGAPDTTTLRAAATAALARWQRRAEHPLAARRTIEAASVVVRSCEGMIAKLS
jgi:hypothetical protein